MTNILVIAHLFFTFALWQVRSNKLYCELLYTQEGLLDEERVKKSWYLTDRNIKSYKEPFFFFFNLYLQDSIRNAKKRVIRLLQEKFDAALMTSRDKKRLRNLELWR